MTVLFVPHSAAEAVFLANRVIVFSQRPARILLEHPVALPASRSPALRTSVEFQAQTRHTRLELLHRRRAVAAQKFLAGCRARPQVEVSQGTVRGLIVSEEFRRNGRAHNE